MAVKNTPALSGASVGIIVRNEVKASELERSCYLLYAPTINLGEGTNALVLHGGISREIVVLSIKTLVPRD